MKKIISIILTAVLCIGLAACGSGSKPEDTVTQFCQAMQKLDFAGMRSLCQGEGGEELEDLFDSQTDIEAQLLGYMRECAGDIKFTVNKASLTGNSASVPVDFDFVDTTRTISAVMDEYVDALWGRFMENEDLSEDEALEIFSQALENNKNSVENDRKQISTTISLTKEGGKWLISELPDAVGVVLTSNIDEAVSSYMSDAENTGSGYGEDTDYDYEGWDSDWTDDWLDYEAFAGFGDLAEERAALGTAIDLTDYRITFRSCRETDKLENSEASYEAEDGTKFVIYDFTVENTGAGTINFSNDLLCLYDTDGNVHYEFYDDYLFCENYLWYTDIEPGESAPSTIVFYIDGSISADNYFIGLETDDAVYEVYGR